MIRSLAEAKKQFATLERNIENATKALLALTPEKGRGRKQIRTKAELIQKAGVILESHNVSDYLHYTYPSRRGDERRDAWFG